MWNNFNVRKQQKLHMLCQYLLPVHLKESYILWLNPKHEWPMDNCWASVYHPRPIWKSSNNFCSVPSSCPGSGACPALAPQNVTPDPCLPLWAYSIHPRPPCLPAPIQCTYMDIVFRCASISSTYPSRPEAYPACASSKLLSEFIMINFYSKAAVVAIPNPELKAFANRDNCDHLSSLEESTHCFQRTMILLSIWWRTRGRLLGTAAWWFWLVAPCVLYSELFCVVLCSGLCLLCRGVSRLVAPCRGVSLLANI